MSHTNNIFVKLNFSEDFNVTLVKVTQILPPGVIAHFSWREMRSKGRVCFTCEMTQTCLLQRRGKVKNLFFFLR